MSAAPVEIGIPNTASLNGDLIAAAAAMDVDGALASGASACGAPSSLRAGLRRADPASTHGRLFRTELFFVLTIFEVRIFPS